MTLSPTMSRARRDFAVFLLLLVGMWPFNGTSLPQGPRQSMFSGEVTNGEGSPYKTHVWAESPLPLYPGGCWVIKGNCRLPVSVLSAVLGAYCLSLPPRAGGQVLCWYHSLFPGTSSRLALISNCETQPKFLNPGVGMEPQILVCSGNNY